MTMFSQGLAGWGMATAALAASPWLPGSPLAPVSASFRPPAKGQRRRVLQFPTR
jgi:hypothetical protein